MGIAARAREYVKRPLRYVRNVLRHASYRGKGRYCPVCTKHSRAFGPTGFPVRQGVMCMYCGAVERHRLTLWYLENRSDLFDGRRKQVLHVAPEPGLERILRRKLGADYTTADLKNPRAMVKMDITDIPYPDESFDVIYCSHVLEHVPDDRRAMREFLRVLKTDGWALLLVPITAGETFEDPSVVDPAERLRLFGQEDHVRRYGPDFVDRLIDAGFVVETLYPPDLMPDEEITKLSLNPDEAVYLCRRNTADSP